MITVIIMGMTAKAMRISLAYTSSKHQVIVRNNDQIMKWVNSYIMVKPTTLIHKRNDINDEKNKKMKIITMLTTMMKNTDNYCLVL